MSRETHIYMARIYLTQAMHSRRHGGWHATLLSWAAKRRIAAAYKEPESGQMELFNEH